MKSAVFSRASVVIAAVAVTGTSIPETLVALKGLLQYSVITRAHNVDELLWLASMLVFRWVAIPLGVGAVAGVVSVVIQTRVVWELRVITPQLQRINPSSGVRRIGTSLRQIPLVCVQIAILSGLFGWLCHQALWISVMDAGSTRNLPALYQVMIRAVWCFGLMIGVVGLIDISRSRRRFREEVYLTRSEFLREHREDEGDPHLKSHRRALHAALARQEMIERIRRSSVVVVGRRSDGIKRLMSDRGEVRTLTD